MKMIEVTIPCIRDIIITNEGAFVYKRNRFLRYGEFYKLNMYRYSIKRRNFIERRTYLRNKEILCIN